MIKYKYRVEKTGGAKTHTLTVNEMPSHTHTVSLGYATFSAETGNLYGGLRSPGYEENGYWPHSGVSSTGGGGAHNNLQPYITVYMWKRTA